MPAFLALSAQWSKLSASGLLQGLARIGVHFYLLGALRPSTAVPAPGAVVWWFGLVKASGNQYERTSSGVVLTGSSLALSRMVVVPTRPVVESHLA